MVTAVTIDRSSRREGFRSAGIAVLWKAWEESRSRFFSALVLLASVVIYAVVTGPDYLERYKSMYPDEPSLYSAYVWEGLFHYALQGLWVLAAFIVTLGGLRREKATGVAFFMLGLPITRLRLFLIRAAVAAAESIALGLVPALLVPVVSSFVGERYPITQALAFGALMSAAGLVIVALGLLLSEIFEGEFTAPAVGLCGLTTIFLSYKARMLSGWSVFDVMSATAYVDPATKLLKGTVPWPGLAICLLVSLGLLFAVGLTIRTRDL
jgi:ABC-type transport system involved in multi-copper enzyme maturation permease subunit